MVHTFFAEFRQGEAHSFPAFCLCPNVAPGERMKTAKIFRSHKDYEITTTAFKVDLMDPAIGRLKVVDLFSPRSFCFPRPTTS